MRAVVRAAAAAAALSKQPGHTCMESLHIDSCRLEDVELGSYITGTSLPPCCDLSLTPTHLNTHPPARHKSMTVQYVTDVIAVEAVTVATSATL